MKLRIEIATLADIPALDALTHTCYRGEASHKGWTTEAHLLGGRRTDADRLKKEMNDPSYTFLKGFDGGEDGQDEVIACCLTQQKGDSIFVGMLCVRPDLQGQGLGKQMMAAVSQIGRQKGCTRQVMEVLVQRTELADWYKRNGWVPTGKMTPLTQLYDEWGLKVVEKKGEEEIKSSNDSLILMEMEKPLLQ